MRALADNSISAVAGLPTPGVGSDSQATATQSTSLPSFADWEKLLDENRVAPEDVNGAYIGKMNKKSKRDKRASYASYYIRFLDQMRSNDPGFRYYFRPDGSGVVLYKHELRIFKNIMPGKSDEAKADEILYRCDLLAVHANEFLVDTQLRNCLKMAWEIAAGCLQVVSAAHDDRDSFVGQSRLGETLEFFEDQLRRTESYFCQSAPRRAEVRYAWGMLIGAMLIYTAAALTLAVVDSIGGPERLPLMLGVFVAGCTGAVLSVMHRMSRSTLVIDYTMGSTVRTLGMFRPLIGAIFGLVVFFILQSGLIPHLVVPTGNDESFFFLAVAFVTGFSERLAQDVLTSTEMTVVPAQLGTVDVTSARNAPPDQATPDAASIHAPSSEGAP